MADACTGCVTPRWVIVPSSVYDVRVSVAIAVPSTRKYWPALALVTVTVRVPAVSSHVTESGVHVSVN